jgi:uncharacterized lipoprotein YddW (UPF0748 family)
MRSNSSGFSASEAPLPLRNNIFLQKVHSPRVVPAAGSARGRGAPFAVGFGKTGLLLLIFFILSAAQGQVRYEHLTDPETGKRIPHAGNFSNDPVVIPSQYRRSMTEMRGIWVATMKNIDFPSHEAIADFKKDFIVLLENLRNARFNTLIFQVRPQNDAFYPSKLNPWSRFLSGTEGKGLGFDPLRFMIDETHKRGMQFHAWLNPYRVTNEIPQSKEAYLKTLSALNFARRRPDLVLAAPAGKNRLLFLNPGEPEVVRFITDTVREIITNYDVDAIHFDDYFYPYGGVGNADAATFQRSNPSLLSLDDWRRANVDSAIKSVSDAIRTHNRKTGKQVEFGVSPFGIWANSKQHPQGSLTGGLQSYLTQFADTRKWVRQGWVDYIAPQIYWSFDHNTAAYAVLADWWAACVRGTPVKLYIGHAAYKQGDGGGWRYYMELPNQLRYNNKHPEIRGSCFFSYNSVFAPKNNAMRAGIRTITTDYWSAPAKHP